MLREENKVNSSILENYPTKFRYFDIHILCKEKNECWFIPKFTEFPNDIFFNMCSTGRETDTS